MEDDIILRARGVTKLYPGTVALNAVDFDIRRGKVNVLIGENGAGKSTLMKILAGVEQCSSGELLYEGRPVSYRNPGEAERDGIVIIYQELNLFPNLSIAENIFVNREITRGGIDIDLREQERKTAEYLEKLKRPLDPKTLVAELRIGEQQLVEIAKAISREAKILIMDEPTSALSESEIEVLFGIIEELKNCGVSIVYISHRLEELLRIGDYITVLRDGKLQATAPVSEVDIPWIVKRMTGDSVIDVADSSDRKIGDEYFSVRGVCLPKLGGGWKVDDVSLTLRRGEILGLYGLFGAGRTELFECIMGGHPEASGEVFLEGERLVSKDIHGRIKDGIVLIPEDRQREGLVRLLSVEANMTLASIGSFTKLFHIMKRKEDAAVDRRIEELSIKTPSRNTLLNSLSGGNQQKVVIGKGILVGPKVLLMDEPTRGIDVAAKADVFRIVRRLAAQGLGVIVATSELKEMLAIADRIIVLSKGRISGAFDRSEATQTKLVAASAAASAASA